MDYVVENYEAISGRLQIVPMSSAQADEAKTALGAAGPGRKPARQPSNRAARRLPACARRRRWGEDVIRAS